MKKILILSMILGIILISFIVNSAVDTTPRTCSDTWGASCADCTDYTMDECSSSSCDEYEMVNEVYVNATVSLVGDTVLATVDAVCNDGTSMITINYNNGSGWQNRYSESCREEGGDEEHTVTIVVDDVVGVHWIRGTDAYGGDAGVTCAEGDDSDNDDVNFTVESAEAPVDPCDCPDGENWVVSCSDACLLGNCFLDNYNLTIDGTVGNFTIDGNISVDDFGFEPGCGFINNPNDNKVLAIKRN